ncbi:hypothetical protein C5167_045096, partial [Papaver somniferum]
LLAKAASLLLTVQLRCHGFLPDGHSYQTRPSQSLLLLAKAASVLLALQLECHGVHPTDLVNGEGVDFAKSMAQEAEVLDFLFQNTVDH